MIKFSKGDRVAMRKLPADWEERNKIIACFFLYYEDDVPDYSDMEEGRDCTLLIVYLDRDGDLETSHWDINAEAVGLHRDQSGKSNFRFKKGVTI